jgi:phospholipid/cholesterol/gamma-HCH transport system substrate-binding protein
MSELKVGLLAIVTIASIIFMSLKVTTNQSGFGKYVKYKTIVKDASGIFPKTPIRVAGINAGRILNIDLEKNAALIEFEVLAKVEIPSDSKLRIKSVGFLGDKYLEIVIGKEPDQMASGGLIAAEEGAGFEEIMKDASDVVKDLKKVVAGVKDGLQPEGQENSLKKIMADVKDTAANAKKFAESLSRMTNGNEQKINELIDNLKKFSVTLKEELDKTDKNSSISDIKIILQNGKKMSADLQQIVADLKAGKGTIGRFLVEDQIADQVSQTLSGMNTLFQRVNAIKAEISVYTGGNTDYGADTRAQIRLFPAPERFYILGISTSDFGPEDERHIKVTQDGTTTNRVESFRDKNEIRLDLQLGRKFNYLSVRGGIIESTGGFGIDYEIPLLNSFISTEVFDYRQGVGINLRMAWELRLWNVIYAKIMAEDLMENSRSFTYLAGLKFNDDDLKALLGLFVR